MFAASALLAVLAIGIAIYVVNVFVTRQAEAQLLREVRETAAIVEALRTTRVDTFRREARLIADLPKLKAAVGTDDPLTVEEIASEYRQQLKANLVVVTNARGRVLLSDVGVHRQTAAVIEQQPGVHDALRGRETFGLVPQSDGILQVATVPIEGTSASEILGTLTVGFLLDDALAAQLKQITGSEVAFGTNGKVLASTLPREDRDVIDGLMQSGRIEHVRLGNDEYIALPQPLTAPVENPSTSTAAVAVILRSRTEQLRFLDAIHTALGFTALLAVALATVLSFAVARTITKPLAALTDVMRDVAATGDLTRKIVVRDGGWADADAQLLASTFNTLTDSIALFQREMSQRERLSSLGRMSTVVAHEIRNPLMIIKGALHSLRRADLPPEASREAIADIDEEVVRLNRIVNEVLDFARPIRFELSTVDLNTLCRESAAASEASGPGVPVDLDLDPRLPSVVVDPERLRQALVNILVNARHAVDAAAERPADRSLEPGAPVSLRTRMHDGDVSVVIADRGVGIEPVDVSRIFDPYFTTKRGGSGLGLAISKNIVEGLGGSIHVTSQPGRGTEIRLDFCSPSSARMAAGTVPAPPPH